MKRPTAANLVAVGEAFAPVQVPKLQPLSEATKPLPISVSSFPSEPLFINVGLSAKAVTKKLVLNSTDYEKSNLKNLIRRGKKNLSKSLTILC